MSISLRRSASVPSVQETGVFVRLFFDGGRGLIEAHRSRSGFRGAPGGAQGGSIEHSGHAYGNVGPMMAMYWSSSHMLMRQDAHFLLQRT